MRLNFSSDCCSETFRVKVGLMSSTVTPFSCALGHLLSDKKLLCSYAERISTKREKGKHKVGAEECGDRASSEVRMKIQGPGEKW